MLIWFAVYSFRSLFLRVHLTKSLSLANTVLFYARHDLFSLCSYVYTLIYNMCKHSHTHTFVALRQSHISQVSRFPDFSGRGRAPCFFSAEESRRWLWQWCRREDFWMANHFWFYLVLFVDLLLCPWTRWLGEVQRGSAVVLSIANEIFFCNTSVYRICFLVVRKTLITT